MLLQNISNLACKINFNGEKVNIQPIWEYIMKDAQEFNEKNIGYIRHVEIKDNVMYDRYE